MKKLFSLITLLAIFDVCASTESVMACMAANLNAQKNGKPANYCFSTIAPDASTTQCMTVIQKAIGNLFQASYIHHGLDQLLYSVSNNLCCANMNKVTDKIFNIGETTHSTICSNYTTGADIGYQGGSVFSHYPSVEFTVFDASNKGSSGLAAGVSNLTPGRICPAGTVC